MAALTTAEWKRRLRPIHDRIYADLVGTTGCGAFDGGCVIVARALRAVIGGEVAVLTRPCGMADHAVVQKDGKLWDYDGPMRPAAFVARFNRNERASCTTSRPMRKDDLPGAARDEALVSRIAILLAEALSGAIAPRQNGTTDA